ncbi:MAG: gamma-glutamylcyclotransferase [Thermoleophilia bacterium]|nr:gamma-glutamylcyclotransferase [Thermoleophilia bacterium]
MDPEQATGSELAALIERAKRYPFSQPKDSYIFTHRGSYPLTAPGGNTPTDLQFTIDSGPASFTGLCASLGNDPAYAEAERTPVFGYGSNSSPEALALKFAEEKGVAIPVIHCEIPDYDVVYAGYVSRGYIPGMIHPSPGATLAGYFTCLTAAELKIMDQSERLGVSYSLAPLTGATGRLENGETVEDPLAFIGLQGHLKKDGSPIAVEGTAATGRTFPAWPEIRMLETVRSLVAPDLKLDRFSSTAMTDVDRRAVFTARLQETELGPG